MLTYLLGARFTLLGGFSLYDVWNWCIHPSFMDITPTILYMLLYNLLFRLAHIFLPSFLIHCLSTILGCAVLMLAILQSSIIHFLVFITLGYVLMYFVNGIHLRRHVKTEYMGVLICVAYLLLCEFIHPNAEMWLQSRGVFMIASMKIISLCFDMQRGQAIPSIISYFGYLCCPANILFGPWISFKEYISVHDSQRAIGFKWLPRGTRALLLSFFFLAISNCWSVVILPKPIDNKWILSYRMALSFRCSHYFVSFLSEATMLCAGYVDEQDPKLGYPITRPLDIEFPSSLVNVVVSWNIPMHKFLKKYVYLEFLKFGYFKAIFGTYLISSLLHGFNREIATVLLTIGLYSYIQFRLQEKLSTEFNACLRVRPCKHCDHKYKRTDFYVKLVHLFFSFVTMFDLMYLGILMDSVGDSHSLSIYEKWNNLDFLSHWLMLGLYIIIYL